MSLSQRYTDIITDAVKRFKNGERRITTANTKGAGWSDENFTILLGDNEITLETIGPKFDSALRRLLIAELSKQTGVSKPSATPGHNCIMYDFIVK